MGNLLFASDWLPAREPSFFVVTASAPRLAPIEGRWADY
jgi:hypothetical protein